MEFYCQTITGGLDCIQVCTESEVFIHLTLIYYSKSSYVLMTLEMPKSVKSSRLVNKIFRTFSTIPWPYVNSFSVLSSVNRQKRPSLRFHSSSFNVITFVFLPIEYSMKTVYFNCGTVFWVSLLCTLGC